MVAPILPRAIVATTIPAPTPLQIPARTPPIPRAPTRHSIDAAAAALEGAGCRRVAVVGVTPAGLVVMVMSACGASVRQARERGEGWEAG